ncbi:HAD family hydrolase [Roseovarius nitratireducens]|uniref:HAD family hydrolase n=1 Tax=Roseovarius nitratireducens TaxID=2044597 RepID=UPI000CE1A1D9|nr:HAD family hydrolase [Roseovarius nitratireducens]
MEAPKHVILVDIDNTLYDWPKFFAPSFRAMCHALRRVLNVPLDELIRDFKSVYAQHDTLEYAFSIQELSVVKDMDRAEVAELIRIGRGAFSKVKRYHLEPYPGVIQGLEYLRKHGHVAISVTNSPLYLAQKRLYELGLDKYISGIVAWEGIDPPDEVDTNFVKRTKRKRTRIDRIETFKKPDAKPSTKPYQIALSMLKNEEIGEIWAIGDSLNKDLFPASTLGIRTIWAKYGAEFDPDSRDNQTLLKITNWSDAEVAHTYDANSFKPDYRVESFSEICQLFPQRNLTLLDLMENSDE